MFKIIEYIPKMMGWMQIAALPILICCGIGGFVYLSNPTPLSLILGLSISLIGLVLGVLWASKIAKKKGGTVSFLSKVMATPELDKIETKKEKI